MVRGTHPTLAVNQTQYVVNSQPNLSQVLVKTEADGKKTFYVYGLGLIGQQTGSEYTSYHFDLRGSTVALTNPTGQITERFQYSPYGVLLSGNAEKTPFLFNGMYGVMTDSNSLYYMRARFYSPEMRRFVNQDILLGGITDGQTLNRYAFVTGNPVKYTDPFGLENFDFSGMGYPFGEPIELGISDVITITITILDAIDLASDGAYVCSIFITGGTSITALPLKKLKKLTIAQIKKILLKIAVSEAKKFKKEVAKISITLDTNTGEVFRGLSGTPYPEDINPILGKQIPKKSLERWEPLNCAEPKACNDALNDNSDAKFNNKDLIMVTIEVLRKIPAKRCKNCRQSTDGVVVLTD